MFVCNSGKQKVIQRIPAFCCRNHRPGNMTVWQKHVYHYVFSVILSFIPFVPAAPLPLHPYTQTSPIISACLKAALRLSRCGRALLMGPLTRGWKRLPVLFSGNKGVIMASFKSSKFIFHLFSFSISEICFSYTEKNFCIPENTIELFLFILFSDKMS